jgi:hypothetical protein
MQQLASYRFTRPRREFSIPVLIYQVNPEVEVHQQSSVSGCPIHPFPSPLPSPLPDKIESAIAAVERRLAGLIDEEAMVC